MTNFRVEDVSRAVVAVDINDSKDEKFGKVQTINIIITVGESKTAEERGSFWKEKKCIQRRINVNNKAERREEKFILP